MERSGNNNTRKRAREEEEEDRHPVAASVAKIKPDQQLFNASHGFYSDHQFDTMGKQHSFDSIFDSGYNNNNNNVAFADGEEGLFDFPWLKEGMIFKPEDDQESDFDNIFASSCSSSSPSSTTLRDAFDSKAEEPKLCQFPNLRNFDDEKNKMKKKIDYDEDEDELLLPSFQADQLEGPDWICSCVFD